VVTNRERLIMARLRYLEFCCKSILFILAPYRVLHFKSRDSEFQSGRAHTKIYLKKKISELACFILLLAKIGTNLQNVGTCFFFQKLYWWLLLKISKWRSKSFAKVVETFNILGFSLAFFHLELLQVTNSINLFLIYFLSVLALTQSNKNI
jgi:hypothetical protein